jgi:chromosome segregation ATPase
MTTADMRALQLETVKNSLEEYKQRSHDLRDEIEALKREREVREGEARQIISFLRHDAERKDDLIESLRNTIEQAREMSTRERENDRLSAAKKLREAEDAFRALEKQVRRMEEARANC